MTESEALELFKERLTLIKEHYAGEVKDYEEALEIGIQALEKQIPKKPIFNCNLSDTSSLFHCECGHTIKVSHDIGIMDNNNAPNYCSRCGCRLDWSDEDENKI